MRVMKVIAQLVRQPPLQRANLSLHQDGSHGSGQCERTTRITLVTLNSPTDPDNPDCPGHLVLQPYSGKPLHLFRALRVLRGDSAWIRVI